MWLIKASLRNPYMVASLVFIMLVLGLVSAFNIPVDILPVFKSPAVQVLTYYQGMPASSVEKTITNRIERWVNSAQGAMRVESKSVPGVSVVKIYFRDDTDPNLALTMTNSLALGTLPTLPPNTLPPVVLPFDPTGTLPLGILTVSNPHLDEAHVKDAARIDVRNMLGAVKGTVAPVVVGGKDRTILVYLKPKELEIRKLSPLDVVRALQEGNLMVTPGTAYFGDNQVLLDTNALVKNVDELNDLPIRMEPGNNVFLRDIGHAEDSYAIQTSRVRINGRQQVYVPVYRQGGASSLDVANSVKDHLSEMEERLPEGTRLDFVMDQSLYVKEAIYSLIHEGIIGAVLVSVMILVFLGNWRMTVIASTSIPLAILGAITGLYATGNTINAMTLGGLALAIGPLVDDAIVGLENTHRHREMGKSRMKAALDGSVEVMIPVMVATCTTIVVLAPLGLMAGMGGFLFRPLALAVAFAMVSSFVLSRTFVPMMCSRFLTDGPHHAWHSPQVSVAVRPLHRPGLFARAYGVFDRFLGRLTRLYEALLGAALAHRWLVLATAAVLFAGSLLLGRRIGREFFPQVDAGQLTLYVRAPSNLRLDAAEARVAKLEEFLKDPDVLPEREREMIVSEIGLDPDWSAAYTANSGQQDSVVRVQLTDARTLSAQEYAVKMRLLLDPVFLQGLLNGDPRAADRLARAPEACTRQFRGASHEELEKLLQRAHDLSDLQVRFDTGGMVSTALNFGVSSPIDIQIAGGTREQAMRLAQEVAGQVRGVPGAADVQVVQRLDAPYLVIDVDRQKAANVGLSARDVVLQVVAAMNSSVSINRNFWIDAKSGNQYFVAVQYNQDPDATEDRLGNVFATGTNQSDPVKLSSLVQIRSSSDAVEVSHVSLYRTFNVLVNTENRDIAGVAGDVEKRIKQISVPEGMRVELKGEYARMNESFRRLAAGLGMASLLVYLLLVSLFRSWAGPFVIMFTVPLGLIGVLTTLWLTGTTLNVQSEMGVIFLVGIAVNNGVLLVDFANKQRKLGATIPEAIRKAAAIRFRPILMTFLATFLDLLPMAIGFGRGSEATVPLARAVVGGLLTSTALTLLVVPVMYTLLIREGGRTEAEVDAELEG
jgi:multidrug efflux pump subunit AcrB